MNRLLPRFHAAAQRIDEERKLSRIIEEASVATSQIKVGRATAGGDMRRLRGIPVCTMGVSGTSPGTNPLAAVLRSH